MDMSIGKAVMAPCILGLLVLVASAASAQNCACVDAAQPPYCVTADAQCWVSANFYNNHIADGAPQARQKILDAYTTGDRRDRSTYFTPQNQNFYKALKSIAGQANGTKSTLTGAALDCSVNSKGEAECSTAKSNQYAVCTRSNNVAHLMSVQKPCNVD
jgi:hydroxylamine reductase (hybrid-cluster protein)